MQNIQVVRPTAKSNNCCERIIRCLLCCCPSCCDDAERPDRLRGVSKNKDNTWTYQNDLANVVCHPASVHRPSTKAKLTQTIRSILQDTKQTIRAFGVGHSTSPLNDNNGGAMVSLEQFKTMAIDVTNKLVYVEAGVFSVQDTMKS
jgi:FAD/FMN-containing dehydrogenase